MLIHAAHDCPHCSATRDATAPPTTTPPPRRTLRVLAGARSAPEGAPSAELHVRGPRHRANKPPCTTVVAHTSAASSSLRAQIVIARVRVSGSLWYQAQVHPFGVGEALQKLLQQVLNAPAHLRSRTQLSMAPTEGLPRAGRSRDRARNSSRASVRHAAARARCAGGARASLGGASSKNVALSSAVAMRTAVTLRDSRAAPCRWPRPAEADLTARRGKLSRDGWRHVISPSDLFWRAPRRGTSAVYKAAVVGGGGGGMFPGRA